MSAPRPVTPIGILAHRLRRAGDRARALHPTDAALLAELDTARSLAGGLDAYVAHCTSPESPALAEISRRTHERDWGAHAGPVALEQEMLSGHLEGATLGFLVWLSGARRALEIGMFTGYATLAIAEALGPEGRVVACELDPEVAAFAAEGFAASEAGARIEVRVGPARDTLGALADAGEAFDFIFIDADKAGYVDYLGAVLDDGLLTPGGVVCVDNTLLQGEPWLPTQPSANGDAIARFNATVAGDPRVVQVLLPIRDGLTLIRRVT